jgi:hypothetical protein
MEKEYNLSLCILPCSEPKNPNLKEKYDAAYKLWKSIWAPTLKELDGVEKLHSNEFTRHDFMTVIFDGDRPISLMCYSEIDLNYLPRRDDSWFENWPQSLLSKHSNKVGEKGILAAWFCTDPEYRKSGERIPFNISQVIIETYCRVILDGGFDIGYGVTRNNRGVGKYGDLVGAITVSEAVAHGCDVNLVILKPDVLKEKVNNYSEGSKSLWDQRIDYREGFYDKRLLKAA